VLTVIIPWRPQPSRIIAFDAVSSWYRENLGDVDVRLVDSGDTPFNLARCRNVGLAELRDLDQPVIVSDADTIPQLGPLLEALGAAASDGLVHLPYTTYRWLGREGTHAYLDGDPIDDVTFTHVRGACSGVYVTTPRTWAAHGGQDERFRGWGFEDAAWYLAHATLLGEEPVRHEGSVFALTHDAEDRAGAHYDANEALHARYAAARGDCDAMRALVFG
jgi:hypothetical protein